MLPPPLPASPAARAAITAVIDLWQRRGTKKLSPHDCELIALEVDGGYEDMADALAWLCAAAKQLQTPAVHLGIYR
jgi:hypothetical protein